MGSGLQVFSEQGRVVFDSEEGYGVTATLQPVSGGGEGYVGGVPFSGGTAWTGMAPMPGAFDEINFGPLYGVPTTPYLQHFMSGDVACYTTSEFGGTTTYYAGQRVVPYGYAQRHMVFAIMERVP